MSGELTDWTDEDSENAAVDAAILENIRLGRMEFAGEEDGEPTYRLTEAGKAHVEHLMQSNPEARALMERLKANRAKSPA